MAWNAEPECPRPWGRWLLSCAACLGLLQLLAVLWLTGDSSAHPEERIGAAYLLLTLLAIGQPVAWLLWALGAWCRAVHHRDAAAGARIALPWLVTPPVTLALVWVLLAWLG